MRQELHDSQGVYKRGHIQRGVSRVQSVAVLVTVVFEKLDKALASPTSDTRRRTRPAAITVLSNCDCQKDNKIQDSYCILICNYQVGKFL